MHNHTPAEPKLTLVILQDKAGLCFQTPYPVTLRGPVPPRGARSVQPRVGHSSCSPECSSGESFPLWWPFCHQSHISPVTFHLSHAKVALETLQIIQQNHICWYFPPEKTQWPRTLHFCVKFFLYQNRLPLSAAAPTWTAPLAPTSESSQTPSLELSARTSLSPGQQWPATITASNLKRSGAKLLAGKSPDGQP